MVVMVAALIYITQFKPNVALKEVTVNVTPERVERGRYLANHFNSLMPWAMYAGMDTTDLEAIYAYLVSLPPVEKKINRFVSAN